MVFNVSSSGSTSAGSWRFKTATAKPESVAKRTIVAVCTTAPTTITIADEEPASPAANDVWFHIINPEDAKVFSDGSVPIFLMGAYAWHAAGEMVTFETTIAGGVIAVSAAAFRPKVDGKTCTKVFTYSGAAWMLDGVIVTLADYGVTVSSGTPVAGSTITVKYISGWAMLPAYYSYLGVWHDLPGLPPVGTALQNCTWAQIDRIGKAGKAAEYFCVGDTKDIVLSTAETITLRIIGFNHDDLAAVEGGKAAITFDFKNSMNAVQNMTRNASNGGWAGGYTGSYLYPILTETIFNTLPSDLRAVIKTVNKITGTNHQGTIPITTAERIFLLSEIEVSGMSGASTMGEGTTYAYFAINQDRVKRISGVVAAWWLRSPAIHSYAVKWCAVSTEGAVTTVESHINTKNGVAAALCV